MEEIEETERSNPLADLYYQIDQYILILKLARRRIHQVLNTSLTKESRLALKDVLDILNQSATNPNGIQND